MVIAVSIPTGGYGDPPYESLVTSKKEWFAVGSITRSAGARAACRIEPRMKEMKMEFLRGEIYS